MHQLRTIDREVSVQDVHAIPCRVVHHEESLASVPIESKGRQLDICLAWVLAGRCLGPGTCAFPSLVGGPICYLSTPSSTSVSENRSRLTCLW